MGDGTIPTIAVEVRSPGQTIATLRKKCGVFLSEGVTECLLIDPRARTLEVITLRGSHTLHTGDTLATASMPGFELNLAALFSVLDH